MHRKKEKFITCEINLYSTLKTSTFCYNFFGLWTCYSQSFYKACNTWRHNCLLHMFSQCEVISSQAVIFTLWNYVNFMVLLKCYYIYWAPKSINYTWNAWIVIVFGMSQHINLINQIKSLSLHFQKFAKSNSLIKLTACYFFSFKILDYAVVKLCSKKHFNYCCKFKC